MFPKLRSVFMARIKFKTKQDQVTGFYELATEGRGRSLPNGVFEIADRYLKILDDAGVAYQVIETNGGAAR
jgi:hypothetical protein